MKKIIILILLLPFLYGAIGYLPSFLISQYRIRKEFKQKIKSHIIPEELIIISIPKGNSKLINWKNGHEFLYQGKLYDIVKKEERKTTTKYYCINDLQEEKLFSNLDKYIKEQQTEKDSSKSNKAKNQIKDYIYPNISSILFIYNKPYSIMTYQFDYISYNQPPLCPPPDFYC